MKWIPRTTTRSRARKAGRSHEREDAEHVAVLAGQQNVEAIPVLTNLVSAFIGAALAIMRNPQDPEAK